MKPVEYKEDLDVKKPVACTWLEDSLFEAPHTDDVRGCPRVAVERARRAYLDALCDYWGIRYNVNAPLSVMHDKYMADREDSLTILRKRWDERKIYTNTHNPHNPSFVEDAEPEFRTTVWGLMRTWKSLGTVMNKLPTRHRKFVIRAICETLCQSQNFRLTLDSLSLGNAEATRVALQDCLLKSSNRHDGDLRKALTERVFEALLPPRGLWEPWGEEDQERLVKALENALDDTHIDYIKGFATQLAVVRTLENK